MHGLAVALRGGVTGPDACNSSSMAPKMSVTGTPRLRASSRAQLRSDAGYTGETWRPALSADETGFAEIRVEPADNANGRANLIVSARFPDEPVKTASVTRELAIDAPKEQP